ncbi:hypothetical protein D0T49_00670 [Paludibacter sp. 221]|uniref:PepSY-like domain-containing protein n=1 Tax=Paludibacter sp. 221 TaxID=2302939 RepID=UPI0013D7E641|nr:PepSY-like domain-containing protein [Paludibacter sp. 221]NDV45566.1 hypothetical protein [Paludibacter sp. 221]
MKTTKIITILTIGILLLFTSCNSDSKFYVTPEIEDALFDKYPDALYLEWDIIDGYPVGSFRKDGLFCRAWFAANGKWLMTETELNSKNYPEEIVPIVENKYGKIRNVMRVDFMEANPKIEPRYVFEVETGNKISNLFFRRNGDLFKKTDTDWENRPLEIDEDILLYLQSNCNNDETVIVDADIHAEPLCIEVYEKKYKTICFDSHKEWLATYWEMSEKEKVPTVVLNALLEKTEGEHPNERYQMEYHIPLYNHKNAKMYTTSEEKTLVYVFKFNDNPTLYIDEFGKEIKVAEIPL